jgi:hypothetical protein
LWQVVVLAVRVLRRVLVAVVVREEWLKQIFEH